MSDTKELSTNPNDLLSKEDEKLFIDTQKSLTVSNVYYPRTPEYDAQLRSARHLRNRRKQLEESQTTSIKDSLTGLYNHGEFMDRLMAEIKDAKRHRHDLALVMLDIDDFKKVNDTHGHLTGDNVLMGVAALLNKEFRAVDIVARYGGEEFAVVLREPDREKINEVLNRVRKNIAEKKFKLPNDKFVNITVSSGTTFLSGSRDSRKRMIGRADEALYKSKDQGKNRVNIV